MIQRKGRGKRKIGTGTEDREDTGEGKGKKDAKTGNGDDKEDMERRGEEGGEGLYRQPKYMTQSPCALTR
jgi:hypothetical protein